MLLPEDSCFPPFVLILPFGICSISDERAIAESIPLLLLLDFEILPFFFEPSFVPLTLLGVGLDHSAALHSGPGPWTLDPVAGVQDPPLPFAACVPLAFVLLCQRLLQAWGWK